MTWKCLGFSNVPRVIFCVGRAPHISVCHYRSALKPNKSSWKALSGLWSKSPLQQSHWVIAFPCLLCLCTSPATADHLCCRGDTEPSWDQACRDTCSAKGCWESISSCGQQVQWQTNTQHFGQRRAYSPPTISKNCLWCTCRLSLNEKHEETVLSLPLPDLC